MLEWIPRGLRKRRITTGYPRRPERAPAGFQGPIEVLRHEKAGNRLVKLCPTGAVAVDANGRLSVDGRRCIGCGACVRGAPERFAFAQRYETAAGPRAVSAPLGRQARALRRSIHVRHVDAGSDGSEEWEIQALWNPYYDIQRLGFFLTSSPRHADILIVTGGVTEPMRGPLLRTWDVMPAPKALIAAGTDACSGGLAAATGMIAGGVDQVLPVDVYVPGSPPSPIALLDGLLAAVGLLRARDAA